MTELSKSTAKRLIDRLPCRVCELHRVQIGLTDVFLVPNGFVIYDVTQDKDVPDLDDCRRTDCPGKPRFLEPDPRCFACGCVGEHAPDCPGPF